MATMKIYRRFIPPPVPRGRAADIPVFALLMLERLRSKDEEKVQQKAQLNDWEDEGGSVAPSQATLPRGALTPRLES